MGTGVGKIPKPDASGSTTQPLCVARKGGFESARRAAIM